MFIEYFNMTEKQRNNYKFQTLLVWCLRQQFTLWFLQGHNISSLWLDTLQHRMWSCKVPHWSRIGRLKRNSMPKVRVIREWMKTRPRKVRWETTVRSLGTYMLLSLIKLLLLYLLLRASLLASHCAVVALFVMSSCLLKSWYELVATTSLVRKKSLEQTPLLHPFLSTELASSLLSVKYQPMDSDEILATFRWTAFIKVISTLVLLFLLFSHHESLSGLVTHTMVSTCTLLLLLIMCTNLSKLSDEWHNR